MLDAVVGLLWQVSFLTVCDLFALISGTHSFIGFWVLAMSGRPGKACENQHENDTRLAWLCHGRLSQGEGRVQLGFVSMGI